MIQCRCLSLTLIFNLHFVVAAQGEEMIICVCVKADLQTSSQRLNLSGGSAQSTVAELAPDDSIDDVIHHEVKELGTHMYAV